MDPGVLDPALRALPIIPVHTVDGIGWVVRLADE